MPEELVNQTPKPLSQAEQIEIQERLQSLNYVLKQGSKERAHHILQQLQIRGQASGVSVPLNVNTPHINSIPVQKQTKFPGNRKIERRIKSLIRWSAMSIELTAQITGHTKIYKGTP